MTGHRRRPLIITTTVAAALAIGGCTVPEERVPSDSDALVLADAYELGGYNPVNGHGEAGESKIYDGLLRLVGGDGMPTFEPALAADMPTVGEDGLLVTVKIRQDVRFTDGTGLDAYDVAATYDAILDPRSASPLLSSLDMIDAVTAADPSTVLFRLEYPYAAWTTKMLLGIAPAERLSGGRAEESSLNTAPVGTGPYKLVTSRPDQAVYEANEDYWDGAPQMKKLTVIYAPDDNTRAQRMAAGEFDGTNVPPLLANTFRNKPGYQVRVNTSADWRGVTLPADNPVTADPAVRMALNLAVDRQGMVDHILGGYGRPASTPIPEVYGAAYEPTATFPHDPARAAALLDEAGWVRGSDGVRANSGVRAEFTIMYFPEDTLRRDLSQAFVSDAERLGVRVNVEAVDRSTFADQLPSKAGLLGGGDLPFDPDPQVYSTLHSRFAVPGAGSPYDNASDYVNPAVDRALDDARRVLDPQARAAHYRTAQTAYVADPGYVMLVFLNHTYVERGNVWTGSTPVLEPHSHGVNWGPWWNLRVWTRR